jgi:hypothetical protein
MPPFLNKFSAAGAEYAAPMGLAFILGFGATKMPRRWRWDGRPPERRFLIGFTRKKPALFKTKARLNARRKACAPSRSQTGAPHLWRLLNPRVWQRPPSARHHHVIHPP